MWKTRTRETDSYGTGDRYEATGPKPRSFAIGMLIAAGMLLTLVAVGARAG